MLIRSLSSILICMTLSGCMALGVATFGSSHGEVNNPRAILAWDGSRVIPDWDCAEPMPSARLLEEWGEPDSRQHLPGGSEHWTYVAGLRWAGAVICVVVLPLPLVLPVGRENVTFVIENRLVVGAESNTTQYGAFCGVSWAPSIMHGGGWSAECESSIGDGFSNPFR